MWVHGDRGGIMPKTCIWLDGATCFRAGPDGNEAVLVGAGRGGRERERMRGRTGQCWWGHSHSSLVNPLIKPFPRTPSPHALQRLQSSTHSS